MIGAAVVITLVATRLVGLDSSIVHDEAFSISQYIDPGPEAIYFGEYEPNNHVLFNLLTWATTSVLGSSEPLYRLWGAVPGLIATLLAMWWAWRRLSPYVALTFGLLTVATPLLLSLFQQARGYGLVALAAVGALVAADRYLATGQRRWLAAFGVAGFVGIGTHVIFLLGFLGQVAVLALSRVRRREVALCVAAVGVATLLFYAPLLPQILRDANQYYVQGPGGSPALVAGETLAAAAAPSDARPGLGPAGVVTGPMHLMAPTTLLVTTGEAETCQLACFSTADLLRYGGPALLLVVLGVAALWLGRRRQLVALLMAPVLTVYVPLTVIGFVVIDRYVAFVLLHLWLLAAIGVSAIGRLFARNTALTGAVLALGVVAAVAVLGRGTDMASTWVETPYEDFKGVGKVVDGAAPAGVPDAPVVTNSVREVGIRHYVGDRLKVLEPAELSEWLCERPAPFIFIDHALKTSTDITCLARRKASSVRILQRGRGGHIDVWLVAASR